MDGLRYSAAQSEDVNVASKRRQWPSAPSMTTRASSRLVRASAVARCIAKRIAASRDENVCLSGSLPISTRQMASRSASKGILNVTMPATSR